MFIIYTYDNIDTQEDSNFFFLLRSKYRILCDKTAFSQHYFVYKHVGVIPKVYLSLNAGIASILISSWSEILGSRAGGSEPNPSSDELFSNTSKHQLALKLLLT